MITQKYIALSDLPLWLAAIAQNKAVFVPQKEGKAVVYRPYTQGVAIELDKKPTESAKHVVFPRSECLFSYEKKRINDEDSTVVALHEPEDPKEAVIFGLLPCDTRGFLAFDPVYNGSGTHGLAKDVYYLKRRASTILVAHACKTVLSTCFCNWVGAGPAGAKGSDAIFTEIEGGLFILGVTEAGQALIDSLPDATDEQRKMAEAAHKAVLAKMSPAPDLKEAKEALMACFDDMGFWEGQSAKCLSCGTCTYLCPTCYCFNITDETNGINGVRLRSWDNCMASMFTLEASGHNPRMNKIGRLRNRVGHKFSYYPSLHEEKFSCVGCGRCIKSCPSSVDIRQIVLDAISHAKNRKEAANG